MLRSMSHKRADDTRSIGEWAAEGDPSRLLAASRRYRQLEQRLRQRLPPELADHFQVARIRDRQLVLLADNPAWHTRLRMQAERLREIADELLDEPLDAVVVRTRPAGSRPGARSTRGRTGLSQHARHCLQGTAASVSDPELSATLQRIVKKSGGNA